MANKLKTEFLVLNEKSKEDGILLLSVNQLAAQIKLIEVWKSVNVEGHPLSLDPYTNPERSSLTELRPQPNRVFNDTHKLKITSHSFCTDAARVWNQAPAEIKSATTLNQICFERSKICNPEICYVTSGLDRKWAMNRK